MADKIILSWSGGKDSALALERLIFHGGYQLAGIFTVYNRETGRVNLHGTPIGLIRKQANAIGVPLYEIPLPANPSNEIYESAHLHLFSRLKEQGVHHCAYGDIFLPEIRAYRENLAVKADMYFSYPLWENETARLAYEVVKRGYKAIVTAINADKMPGNMLGRQYDESFISEIPDGVDLCGENGEFHTFVWDGPTFKKTIPYVLGERYEEDYRPAIDMQMKYIEIMEEEEKVKSPSNTFSDLV